MIWTKRPDWYDQARCKGYPPELFYGFEGERPKLRDRRLELVTELCAACPVVELCREEGATDPYGIWGGSSELERYLAGTCPRSNSAAQREARRLGLIPDMPPAPGSTSEAAA